MVGLLFPGQGSQHLGMGRELAAEFPLARETFAEADEVLGFALSRLCWEGPETELTLTSNAQPALLAHSIAVHRVLHAELGPVSMAAGHSLGEFSAYVAAGALAFADGLRTVRRRGELMLRAGTERPGAMAAILGLDDDGLERVCAEASGAGGVCVPANYNSPAQTVVSGDTMAVQRAMELAKAAGAKKTIRLNVSGAFHSPLMQAAEAGLEAALAGVALEPPAFPVVSNVTAQPVSEVAEARRLLVSQLTSPVRWTASMRTMLEAGITDFLELGSGHVLAGLLKRLHRGGAVHSIGTPESVAAWKGGVTA